MDFDLVIKGANVIDGTGSDAVLKDVAVSDGRILQVGDVSDSAIGSKTEIIEAHDRVVSPGFVDIHTHYDAQIMWDRSLSCSPWHGVTTAVIGNCGFGVAPMRPEHRDTIMATLEKVEGMSYEALKAGLGQDWPFTTYPQYLDCVERGSSINVASYVGHTPIRLYVMGEDATEREATASEVTQMAELVAEAMRAGAVGFSTSQAATHHGAGGKPVPSRLANFDEIDSLVAAVADNGGGVVQGAMGRTLNNSEFEHLAETHGVAVTWTALLAGMTGPGSHKRYLDIAADQSDRGLRIVPQVACRPIMFDFRFDEPYPFELLDSFGELVVGDRASKMRAYSDPAFRAAFKAESEFSAKNVNAGWPQRCVVSRFDPDPTVQEQPLDVLAERLGKDPVDLALDMAIETGLEARFRFAFLNHDQSEVRELICHPNTVVTLSDAGAHADQLCDAGYSTHLLGHWVREEKAMSIEEAVRRLTSEPADLMGFNDRGRIAPGAAADLVIFDPDTVAALPPRRVTDQPGNNERLVSDSVGVDAVLVNGTPIRRGGENLVGTQGDRTQSELPGTLLRRAST